MVSQVGGIGSHTWVRTLVDPRYSGELNDQDIFPMTDGADWATQMVGAEKIVASKNKNNRFMAYVLYVYWLKPVTA